MNYIKRFEDIKNDSNIETIQYLDIFKGSPKITKINNQKNWSYIRIKLDIMFLNKIVTFHNDNFKTGKYEHKIVHGEVVKISYDNDNGNKIVYFVIKGDDYFYSLSEEYPIIIHNDETDANKYNL